jgi:pentatricopeptide repeat protein
LKASKHATEACKRLVKVANSARPRFLCYGEKLWIPTTDVPHLNFGSSQSLQSPPSLVNQLKTILQQADVDGKAAIAQVKEMVALQQQLEPPMLRNLFSKLSSSARPGNLAILRSFLLSHNLYSDRTYQMDLEICKQAANLDEALKVYKWWHSKSKTPFRRFELLLLLELHATPERRLPHEATKLFKAFIASGLRKVLGTAGFNALLRVWASVGPSGLVDDQLRSIFEEMDTVHQKKPPKSPEGSIEQQNEGNETNREICRPDSQTFEIMISHLQDMRLVEHYYRMALTQGRTSPQVHERYLFRLSESMQKTRALKWYRKMLEHRKWRNEINEQTLLTVLQFCTVTGDMTGTRSVFSDATELGITPTTAMYATLIALCARLKNTDMAENILVYDLPRHGLEIDEHIYSALIMLYCAVDNLSKAATLYQEMKATGCPLLPNTLTPLINGYFEKAKKTNDMEFEVQAQRFWQDRKAIRVKPTLNLLSSIFLNSTDTAFLANLMKDLLSYIDGIQPLHALARRILYSNEHISPERALFLFKHLTLIPEFRIEHWMYDLLFKILSESETLGIAFELAQEAVEIAFFLNWQSARPDLKWTSNACMEKLQALGYPFHLTDTHGSVFFETFIASRPFSSSVDWHLKLDPVSKKPWAKDTLLAWGTDLSSWQSQARHMNLIPSTVKKSL